MVTTRSQIAVVPSPAPLNAPLKAPKKSDELPKPLQHALTDAVSAETLTKLLIVHAEASKPRNARVIAITPDSVSISYLQPVREYWFKPLQQTITIRIAPALPAIPAHPDDKWITETAMHLTRFAEKDEVPVDRFIAPAHWQEFLTLAVFLGFTLLILAQILGVQPVADYIFTTERRFNIAIGVHCAVLIKRSRDVRQLGDLLEKHWKGGRAARVTWVIAGWLEGWRAVSRLRAEVGRIRIKLLAEEEDGKESKKKK